MSHLLNLLLTPTQRLQADMADLAGDPMYTACGPNVAGRPRQFRAVDMPAATAAHAALHKALAAKNDAADDIPTLEEATEEVLWRYSCTPGVVSQWINNQCCAQNDPIDAGRLPGACAPLTAGQALVLLMTGPLHSMSGAAMRLRELFEDDSRPIAASLALDEIALQRRSATA